MKRIITIILNILLSLSALISTVSASNDYEDNGAFRYIYNDDKSGYGWVLYKAQSPKEEINLTFPEEYKGSKLYHIGITDNYENLNDVGVVNINNLYIPKTVEEVWFECVSHPEYDGTVIRLTNIRNIVVDKDNPYLCSKDGVLYSKDMKTLCLYPNRNSMTIYKMPNSIKNYNINVPFMQRNNLKKLYLSNNLKEIGYYFAAKCKKLEYVSIGKKTKEIGEYAFYENKKLKTIKIKSKKLKNINSAAFGYCKSLKKITLPPSVKKIDEFAFGGCKNLSKVYVNNKKKSPKIVYNAFENTKKGIKFYVKNKKVAKSLKKQLKGSGVRNAKILVGKKVVYKNVK